MHPFPKALRRFLLAAPIVATAPLAMTASLPAAAHGDDAPNVVISIKPIHGIASAIMKDIGKPVLLLDGASSPHAYSLRPSEARALRDADLVVYVSHSLESFLQKPLQSLSDKSHVLELIDLNGLALRDMREGGTWETHDHDHTDHDEHADHDDHEEHGHDDDDDHDHEDHHDSEHDTAHGYADEHDHDDHDKHADHDRHDEDDHHEEHGSIDPHIWLDPANGATIAVAIADELSHLDPEHADDYRENLKTLLASLHSLGNDLRTKVAPIRDNPYVVFHDAYQYLEAGFGLNAVGSITVSPDQKPGAKRLHEIEDKILDTGARCIFAEPQFRPAIVQAVVADTGIHTGTLDPLGASIAAGPTAYQDILEQNVDALVKCLSNGT